MRKPHEEEWAVWSRGYIAMGHGEGTVVASVQAADATALDARAAFVAAAPDMARALLGLLDRRADGTMHLRNDCSATRLATCDDSRCAAVRAALTKAGVPLE